LRHQALGLKVDKNFGTCRDPVSGGWGICVNPKRGAT
jgi:hypothetical protein